MADISKIKLPNSNEYNLKDDNARNFTVTTYYKHDEEALMFLMGDSHMNGVSDNEPYLFRKSGGSATDIGNRESDRLVGGTIAWNQLLHPIQSKTENGITGTQNADGTYTVNGTATGLFEAYQTLKLLPSHVYLLTGVPSGASLTTYYSYWLTARKFGNQLYKRPDNGGTGSTPLSVIVPSGSTVSNVTFKLQAFDLTQMFGSTIADYIYSLDQNTPGAGAVWFKKYFPNDYYDYDPGSLQSVQAVAHKTVGFNQWDEEWEIGSLTNGMPRESTINLRSKNYCSMLPNTRYHLHSPMTVWFAEYDNDKNFLGYVGGNSGKPAGNHIFTSQPNTKYFRFVMTSNYGVIYNHDICINFSDPAKNGTYEPYSAHTYALDSSVTLRGIPKLDSNNQLYYDGDTYTSDGTVTRKRRELEVTSSNGVSTSTTGKQYATIVISPGITEALSNNFLSDKYQFRVNAPSDDEKWFRIALGYLFIFDSRFTDMTVTNNILASEKPHFVYELTTPTTETADGFNNPQVVDPSGTEEYITTTVVPVGHETDY